jgi:hypothetical protein
MRALLILLTTTLPAAAQSFSVGAGAPREYP